MTKGQLYQKLDIYFLMYGFTDSLKALKLTETIDGFRKDGVTPSVIHQLSVADYLLPFITSLKFNDTIYATALLHDSYEDNHIKFGQIKILVSEAVDREVLLLTKTSKSTDDRYFNKSIDTYYANLSESPIAVVIKGADRIHNCSTMQGAFSPEKIKSYIEETKRYVIPMLNTSMRRFVDYKEVIDNEITVLNMLMRCYS